MMRRRNFFGALLAGAAAFVVAPAAKAETAPAEATERLCCNGACGGQDSAEAMPTLPEGEVWVLSSEVREARAEGYERGRAVGAAAQESRYDLQVRNQGFGYRFRVNAPDDKMLVTVDRHGTVTYGDDLTPDERMLAVAHVNEWRCSLHEGG